MHVYVRRRDVVLHVYKNIAILYTCNKTHIYIQLYPRNDRDDMDDPRHGGSVLGDYKYRMTPVSTVYRSRIGTS